MSERVIPVAFTEGLVEYLSSVRVSDVDVAAAKKIAARKSVGYQTQLRMWIAEGIQREGKRG